MRVAYLYNLRRIYPDANDPLTQLQTDYDDQKTIDSIKKHLENNGYQVMPIEADEEAYLKLKENKQNIDLVFNCSEGIRGKDREAQFPSIFEVLKIPYTGSSPLTQVLVLNKTKAKEILIANNIPTPKFQVFTESTQKLNDNLKFPLIVKPESEGSSAGITNKSVVKNNDDLVTQIEWVLNKFSEPVLVEEFLQGKELSVAMLGNPPNILPIIEADHSSLPQGYTHIDSLEVKWYLEEEKEGKLHLICPAKISSKLQKEVENICIKTWNAMRIYDFCRIDLRCDNEENPYVLEINSPPGIIPPEIATSYFPLAAKIEGIEYDQMLKMIIDSALKRYKQKTE